MENWKLENKFLKVIVSNRGAELQSILNKKNGCEYLWQGDEKHWGRRAPVLFPIIGKLNNDEFSFEKKIFTMKKHGFARDNFFTLKSCKEKSIKFFLDKKFETYPFLYSLTIKYSLHKNSLKVKYMVKNCDNKEIFFSIGGHPAFNCPIEKNLKFEDYYIYFSKTESENMLLIKNDQIVGTKKSYIKNKKIELNRSLFNDDALIIENPKSKTTYLKSEKDEKKIEFKFKNFNYIAFWTKYDTAAPFICFEPWCGIDDYINSSGNIKEKKGIIKLDKDKSFKTSYSIKIY